MKTALSVYIHGLILYIKNVICYKNHENLYLLLCLIQNAYYFQTVFFTIDVLFILLSSLEK